MSGSVWLVGAGPGAPDLLTLRALWCLERADVVVHDRLIHPTVLEYAPCHAERIDVGKRSGGGQSHRQVDINAILVERAQRGARVVRLKGGDPFVFGRGAEEAQALAEAGVPFEIVPGLSSALAAPAAAGIPLTRRGVAHAFTVTTGTGIAGAALSERELESLGRSGGTLVLLMAVHRLEELVEALLSHGRSACEPCAIVMHATWSTQRIIRGPLASIAQLARSEHVSAPAVLIVGPTVDVQAGAL